MRWRRVDLLKQITLAGGIAKGDELVLDLFPDTSYRAMVDRVSVDVQGSITIRGRLRNYPLGYVLISTTGDLSLASIHVPELGVEYKIVYEPDSRCHYLLENDPFTMDKLEDSPVVIPPPPNREEKQEIEALQERVLLNQDLATATIDVLVVYTPAAKQWADSSGGGISNVVAQTMEKAQLVADNSGADFAVLLVHSAEVAYTESGDSSDDLDRLQESGDGYLDSVHTLRSTFGADVVVMFTKVEDVGGIGYLLDTPSGSPAYAFSITRVQQASLTYTTIHEIGHNMGLHHHKDQNVQPGPGLYSYSAGWRWVSTDSKRYCSVMTYEDGKYFSDGMTHTRVPLFSNPSLAYIGAATGHATNGDNARNVREIKNVIAAYRTQSLQPVLSVTPSNQAVSKDAGTTTFSVSNTGTETMPWTAIVTSGNSWLTITSGASGSNSGTVNCSITANITTSPRTGTIRVTATGATGSPVDVTVTQTGTESLAAGFAGSGLWIYNSGTAAWTQVSSVNPKNMIYSGSTLYVDFGASYGLYKWDGAAWAQLTSANPENMVASGSTLYAGFGALGLYKFDGAAWTQLTTANPENMVASGSLLYADFGASGLYKFDGAAWTQLTSSNPEKMVTSGVTLYVGFRSLGLYKWDGTSWSQLTSANPENMVTSGATLYVNFGATYGLQKWNGTAWTQLTSANPENMAASDSSLYANFGASGLYKFDGAAWAQLTTTNPENMVTSSDSTLYVNFGALGIHKWKNSSWSQLTGSDPVIMVISN